MSIREMKQSELVEKTGIDKGQMSSYLAGRYKPKQTNLNLIAKALSVDEAWLMGYDVPMEHNDYEDSTILKRDAILEDIENLVHNAGYIFSYESYDDDFFLIKQPYGQTIASFYDYELIPKYELLKRNGKLTAELLISDSSKLCPSEMEHIKKYRSLDAPGRSHVDSVLDWELERTTQAKESSDTIEHLQQKLAIHPTPPRFFAYYGKIAAAGTSVEFSDIAAGVRVYPENEINKGADYVIGVNGASMEPEYSDGDIVYVKKTEHLNVGDIGIFQKANNIYIKKVGETGLISLNPKYPGLTADGDRILVLGKVLGKAENN